MAMSRIWPSTSTSRAGQTSGVPTINPNRIELARRRRGLTKTKLAEGAGVSSRILTDYLSGRKTPSETTLDALAAMLEMPLAFFYGDDLDEPPAGGVSFRALSSMTARQYDQAMGAATIAMQLDDWIRARFKLPGSDIPHLRNLPSDDHEHTINHAETIAESLRERWGLGERRGPNMVHLLEAHGVRVYSLAQECAAVDAFSFWRGEVPYVFLNNYKTAERSRMDSAHELGHLVMHAHGGPEGRLAESEAQAFAAAFLMPRRSVLADAPRSGTAAQIIHAKGRWNVSAMNLAHRMHRLGLLSDWQVRSTYVQLTRHGYRDGEPRGIEQEASQILPKVFAALSHEGITRRQLARELHISVQELNSVTFGLTIANGGEHPDPDWETSPHVRRELRVVP
jgi:Zn-dependent peptidase ImmA (M78 family)/transcriptional regulator with XRE-family HTH domain